MIINAAIKIRKKNRIPTNKSVNDTNGPSSSVGIEAPMFRLAALSIFDSRRISQVCASLLSSAAALCHFKLRTRGVLISSHVDRQHPVFGILPYFVGYLEKLFANGVESVGSWAPGACDLGARDGKVKCQANVRCQYRKFAIQASLPDAKQQRACNANRRDPEFGGGTCQQLLDELSHLVALCLLGRLHDADVRAGDGQRSDQPCERAEQSDPHDDVTQGCQTRGVSAHLVIQNVDRWPKSFQARPRRRDEGQATQQAGCRSQNTRAGCGEPFSRCKRFIPARLGCRDPGISQPVQQPQPLIRRVLCVENFDQLGGVGLLSRYPAFGVEN